MREFKFKCPVCGQHIKSTPPQSGSVMECPTCFQRIVVPQAPESDDTRLIVTGTRYTQRNLPAGDARAKTGSIKDKAAAAPPSEGKKLPIVPIIAVVVLIGLGVVGYLYGGKFLKHGSGDVTRWVADQIGGTEGMPVYDWKDTVSGVEAVQGRSDGTPTLHLHAMNGHSLVHFQDEYREFLTVQGGDSPMANVGDFTLVTVFSTSVAGHTGEFYDSSGIVGVDQFGVAPDWGLCLSGQQLCAGLGGGNSGCNQDVSIYGGSVADARAHVGVYVRAGDSVNLYLDGIQIGGQSSLCTAPRGSFNFQIGALAPDKGYFHGNIPELQIYKHALQPSEIVKLSKSLGETYGVGSGQKILIIPGGPGSPGGAAAALKQQANAYPALPVQISAGRIGIGTWDTQIAVSNVVVTSGGEVLYSSDFSSNAKPKNWTIGSGRWVFGDGLMEQLASGQGPMAVTGDENWSSYIYKAQVAKLGGDEGFLLLFNFKNVNNYAQFNIGGWGNAFYGIEYVVNGNKTTGPRVPGSVKMNQWYNVELDVNNNNVRCYIDGKLILSLGNY